MTGESDNEAELSAAEQAKRLLDDYTPPAQPDYYRIPRWLLFFYNLGLLYFLLLMKEVAVPHTKTVTSLSIILIAVLSFVVCGIGYRLANPLIGLMLAGAVSYAASEMLSLFMLYTMLVCITAGVLATLLLDEISSWSGEDADEELLEEIPEELPDE